MSEEMNPQSGKSKLDLLNDKHERGSAVYTALIAEMKVVKDGRLQHDLYETYANSHHFDKVLVSKVIKSCIELELFSSDGICFWANDAIDEKPELESDIND
ncbi:MAG: hypothetical protein KGZ71_09920 [Desulfobulbaceae bacterium]|nr:hypothetical protein [Desulfobulbaceae bacterium]